MRSFIRNTAFALLLATSIGLVFAEYRPEYDVYITVDDELLQAAAETYGIGAVGWELFGLQEGAHEAVTDTTGQGVDHYYIWVCVGGECVPIDPFTVGN